jgi:hypothetical protein
VCQLANPLCEKADGDPRGDVHRRSSSLLLFVYLNRRIFGRMIFNITPDLAAQFLSELFDLTRQILNLGFRFGWSVYSFLRCLPLKPLKSSCEIDE